MTCHCGNFGDIIGVIGIVVVVGFVVVIIAGVVRGRW